MKAIQRFKTPIIVQEVDILDQTASVKNLEQWIEELDQFNQTPGNGTTRPVFTAEDMAARSYVHKLMESVGLEVKEDNAGNLFGVLPGENPSLEPVWTGSHIDTVPNGGKYDGIAGVFAGIEALRMIKESGAPHKRSLSANVYSGEEMSRFGVCCIGSRAIAGRLHLEDLKSHSDPSGTSLYQALKDVGYDPDSFDEEFPCKTPVYASLELHIEQNDVLEKANCPVGIVTGICAPTNLIVEVFGVQSHAGGTSMTARKDAYMAAAEISLLLERLALESDSMYITGTVGEMTLEPNAANVIPGHATFSVDIRSVAIEDKDALLEKFYSGIKEIEERRKVKVTIDMMNHDKAVICDEHIVELVRQSSTGLGIPAMDIVSGPYHDSLMLGDITKVGMLFVPSKDGISHNKAEWTSIEDIAKGTDILANTLLKLANEA